MTDQYLLGIDYGTESCRVGIFTTDGKPVTFAATPYETHRPRPGWGRAVARRLVERPGRLLPEGGAGRERDPAGADPRHRLRRHLVLAGADGRRRPGAAQRDHVDGRPGHQAAARADVLESEVRRYNAGGTQPSSAEWAPFKMAWLKENEPELYGCARWLLDAPDWLGACS